MNINELELRAPGLGSKCCQKQTEEKMYSKDNCYFGLCVLCPIFQTTGAGRLKLAVDNITCFIHAIVLSPQMHVGIVPAFIVDCSPQSQPNPFLRVCCNVPKLCSEHIFLVMLCVYDSTYCKLKIKSESPLVQVSALIL
jgi:hypothetical protein